MRRAKINPAWQEAEFEETFLYPNERKFNIPESLRVRYATAEDGIARRNPIYAFHYVEVP